MKHEPLYEPPKLGLRWGLLMAEIACWLFLASFGAGVLFLIMVALS